jgi:APA family basic amino acid/polyamine antiporter
MALQTGGPWLSGLVSVAAVAAMCGVGLNLLLGLSRVLLAMARRGDAPAVLATLDASGTTPGPAVLATAGIIAALVCLGDVRATWSFSAFTVLVYYAITNASALRLPASSRRYPRAVSWVGLAGCLSLSVWITPRYVLLGMGLLAVGHVLRAVLRRAR